MLRQKQLVPAYFVTSLIQAHAVLPQKFWSIINFSSRQQRLRQLGDKNEKAKASLKNSELIQRFKEVDSLPEDEQDVLIKIISAYVGDYKAKQAYAS